MRRKEEEERGEEEEERGGVEEDVDTQVMLMKRRIRFHFMNPFEKWAYRGRRRFPWKLLLQLLNVVLVVTQVSDTKVMQYKGLRECHPTQHCYILYGTALCAKAIRYLHVDQCNNVWLVQWYGLGTFPFVKSLVVIRLEVEMGPQSKHLATAYM